MAKMSVLLFLNIPVLIGIIFGFAYLEKNSKFDNEKASHLFMSVENEVSQEAFETVMKVVTHKRCMNCHPKGDQPRQGEDSHLHYFGVQRGEDGHGIAALKCETCHQKENNLNSGVPGAPEWHLAPLSMAWEGLSKVEIASLFMNPATNGGKSPEEIEKHMTEDDLVLWAFEPGVSLDGSPREKPPVSKEEFIEAVKIWIANGAKIPAE